jgi:transcriptional regulator with XRE-family HTH domain
LRAFRVRAGLSQEALAADAGVGLTTLKALERDQRRRPQMPTLVRLAEALGLAAAERTMLLDRHGSPKMRSIGRIGPPNVNIAQPV